MPAIVQDATDGTVLTVAYMDAEALRRTLATGRTWFYSRSRQEYWQKGETSGDRQYVREVRLDCDGDALVVLVDQHGRGRLPHRGALLLLPDHRDGPGGARAVTPGGGPGAGRARLPPDPAEFAALAKEHAIVPVWCEVVADTLTPVACFANVVGDEDGFLFESVEGGERWGRYSFVGRRPLATLTARGRAVDATGRLGLEPLATTASWPPSRRSSRASSRRRWPGCPRCTAGWSGISATTSCARSSGCPTPPDDDLGPSRRRARRHRPVLPPSTTGASASS